MESCLGEKGSTDGIETVAPSHSRLFPACFLVSFRRLFLRRPGVEYIDGSMVWRNGRAASIRHLYAFYLSIYLFIVCLPPDLYDNALVCAGGKGRIRPRSFPSISR